MPWTVAARKSARFSTSGEERTLKAISLQFRCVDLQPGCNQELGEPTESKGVTESWIEFETSVGRGVGQLRIKEARPGPR
jgi:hypothetical protein